MADADHEAEFDKAFEGFGEEEKPTPQPEPPKEDDKKEEPPKEEDKDQEEKPPVEPPKEEDKEEPPVALPKEDDKKEEGTPEEPKPLTEDSIRNILKEVRTEERSSSQAIEEATNEVLEAYYPEGLSNTLIDQTSGKELKVPADVVEASGGQMSMEEAAQWLMNEQFKLDKEVARIKEDARKVAETTVSFKRDATIALEKYEPLFKAYPHLQTKIYEKLMKQVKVDNKKGLILSAPDVLEYYDDYLEPYQQAFEFSTKQSATNPTPDPKPEPPKPSADDRLDENGDGGPSPVNDPNDFAQQVTKELAKPL